MKISNRQFVLIGGVIVLIIILAIIVWIANTKNEDEKHYTQVEMTDSPSENGSQEAAFAKDLLSVIDVKYGLGVETSLEPELVDFVDSDNLLFYLDQIFGELNPEEKSQYKNLLEPPTSKNSFFAYSSLETEASLLDFLRPIKVKAEEPLCINTDAWSCFDEGSHVVLTSLAYPNLEVVVPQDVTSSSVTNSDLIGTGGVILTTLEQGYAEYNSFFPVNFPSNKTIRVYVVESYTDPSAEVREFRSYYADDQCGLTQDTFTYPPVNVTGELISCDRLYVRYNAPDIENTTVHELFHCFQMENGVFSLPFDPVENTVESSYLDNWRDISHFIESTAMYAEELVFGTNVNAPTYERTSLNARDGIWEFSKRYPDGLFWLHRAELNGAADVKQEILAMTPQNFYREQMWNKLKDEMHQWALDYSGIEYLYSNGLATPPKLHGNQVDLKQNCSKLCVQEGSAFVDLQTGPTGYECSLVDVECTEAINGDYIKINSQDPSPFFVAHVDTSIVMETEEGQIYKELEFLDIDGGKAAVLCLTDNDYCQSLGISEILPKPENIHFIVSNSSLDETFHSGFDLTIENSEQSNDVPDAESACALTGTWQLVNETVHSIDLDFRGRILELNCGKSFSEDYSATEPVTTSLFGIDSECTQTGSTSGNFEFVGSNQIKFSLDPGPEPKGVCTADGTATATGPVLGELPINYEYTISSDGLSLTLDGMGVTRHELSYVKVGD